MGIRTLSEAKDLALIALITLNVGAIVWSVKTNMRLDKEGAVLNNVVQSNVIKIEKMEEKNDNKNEEQDKRITQLEMVLPSSVREKKVTNAGGRYNMAE